jgi:hypothetical protein
LSVTSTQKTHVPQIMEKGNCPTLFSTNLIVHLPRRRRAPGSLPSAMPSSTPQDLLSPHISAASKLLRPPWRALCRCSLSPDWGPPELSAVRLQASTDTSSVAMCGAPVSRVSHRDRDAIHPSPSRAGTAPRPREWPPPSDVWYGELHPSTSQVFQSGPAGLSLSPNVDLLISLTLWRTFSLFSGYCGAAGGSWRGRGGAEISPGVYPLRAAHNCQAWLLIHEVHINCTCLKSVNSTCSDKHMVLARIIYFGKQVQFLTSYYDCNCVIKFLFYQILCRT